MDWGVHLPHLGRAVTREGLMTFAQEIERLGFHSGWVSDHVCWPAEVASKYPYSDDGSFGVSPDKSWLDAIGTMTFVAACTERLRLGTSVLIIPYRPPVQTAKQLATVDVLSGGRLILGIGVGWMAEEAEILGAPWDHRGARTNEQLEIFAALFGDAEPSYEGRYYRFPKVGFEPKPVQQPVPIWVGGATPAAFKRAARYGHGFHAAFQPLAEVKAEWAAVRAECEALGRDPGELRLSLRVYLDPAAAMPPEKSIAGRKDQMLETIGQLSAAGVDHVLLDTVARGGVQGRLDALADFQENVAAAA